MNRDFLSFQKWFKFYQAKLGLNNYQVYFKYEAVEDSFADIEINQEGMVATVRLSSQLGDKDKPFMNPRNHAKHEAIHLLIGRLEARARERYTTSKEAYEAVEELARRIGGLID